jgi:hypothetical protein
VISVNIAAMPGPSPKYLARAAAFAAAIDVATKLMAARPARYDAQLRRHHAELTKLALAPKPAFAKLASLRFLEQDFFTYWNETPEARATAFWRELAARKLPFERRDAPAEVLARGRITNAVDYEAIGDIGVDDERFPPAEQAKLHAARDAYAESRVRARRRKSTQARRSALRSPR